MDSLNKHVIFETTDESGVKVQMVKFVKLKKKIIKLSTLSLPEHKSKLKFFDHEIFRRCLFYTNLSSELKNHSLKVWKGREMAQNDQSLVIPPAMQVMSNEMVRPRWIFFRGIKPCWSNDNAKINFSKVFYIPNFNNFIFIYSLVNKFEYLFCWQIYTTDDIFYQRIYR